MPPPPLKSNAVFLNVPYDDRFRRLYVAYLVGLVYLGLEPRATVAIPGAQRRLDRILGLLKSCRYSIHDLSRVELDRRPPCTPRFNMPFELGLAVSWAADAPDRHEWFVFETMPHRAAKSLSDLSGTDPNIHGGTVEGVMRELCNAFVRTRPRPGVPQMLRAYRFVSRQIPKIQRSAGAKTVFETRIFADLCLAAAIAAAHYRSPLAVPGRKRRK